jgi:type I restriction enzyme R subunit
MGHLKGLDLNDLDACLQRLAEEIKRQRFQTDVRTFAKRVDMVLPNPAAKPFLSDLKALGKVVIACRNRYRDDHLDLHGCGEKVRALIENHVRAAGIDPRVPPISLFSVEFKQHLASLTSDRAKASEIEQAIKSVLRVKLEEDPAYYQTLSRRLEEIIRKHSDKWEELVQQLLLFRDGMEQERTDQAAELGLSPVEFAFRNALMAELSAAAAASAAGDPATLAGDTEQRVIALTKTLVRDFEEATTIVGFFSKWDEVARIKRQIKRAILDQPFGSKVLVDAVTARFMDLGKKHFQ